MPSEGHAATQSDETEPALWTPGEPVLRAAEGAPARGMIMISISTIKTTHIDNDNDNANTDNHYLRPSPPS